MRTWMIAATCLFALWLLAGFVFAKDLADPLLDGLDPEEGLSQSVLDQIGDFSATDRPDLIERGKELALSSLRAVFSDLHNALLTAGLLLAAMLLTGLLSGSEQAGQGVQLCGVLAAAVAAGTDLRAMVGLGLDTMQKLQDYTGLLLPGLATLASSAGMTGSAPLLYGGSAFFLQLLTRLSTGLFRPLVYGYVALSAAEAAGEQAGLTTLCDFLRWLCLWVLKAVSYIFTGLQGLLTVSGSALDATRLKAARLAMSGTVPLVGGILSDAAQTLLSAAGYLRSAVGVYGLFAIIALCLTPFLRIALHHLVLRGVYGLSGFFGQNGLKGFLGRLCDAMGLTVAMVGVYCLMSFFSVILLLRSVGL